MKYKIITISNSCKNRQIIRLKIQAKNQIISIKWKDLNHTFRLKPAILKKNKLFCPSIAATQSPAS